MEGFDINKFLDIFDFFGIDGEEIKVYEFL